MHKSTPPKTNTLAGKARGASGREPAGKSGPSTFTPAPKPSDTAYSNCHKPGTGVGGGSSNGHAPKGKGSY